MVVNIIVPVYNTESYLKKCLDSIFEQTYKDIHVICVNDGSTDKSLEIINSYIETHKNFEVINKKNGGLSSARNAGLNVITNWDNSYITFIDSDDWVTEDFVEKSVEMLEKTNSEMLCTSFFKTHTLDTSFSFNEGVKISSLTPFDALVQLFEGKIQSHSPCKMYKASLWKNMRFDENISFMEDQAITFKIMMMCNCIAVTNWSGYCILLREGSLCQSKMKNKKILDAMKSYMSNYTYDYSAFGEQQEIIKSKALWLFANTFLMMYPRFNKKEATVEELNEWKNICKFEKENKAVKRYKPHNKKQRIKKLVFRFLKPFYKFLFKFFLHGYDK